VIVARGGLQRSMIPPSMFLNLSRLGLFAQTHVAIRPSLSSQNMKESQTSQSGLKHISSLAFFLTD
jgi:hypothetical protein